MHAYKKYLMTMGLVWGLSLVLFVIFYFFVIAPQLKINAKLVVELAEKQKQYEAGVSASQQDNQKKLADEVENIKSKLAGYVIESEESANLTFDISRIAGDKQVSSFTIKASEPSRNSEQTEVKNLQENGVQITFVSSFKQFATFLNALERHRPTVFIDKFKMVREDRSESVNKTDMDISFFVKKRPES